jgi:hypothetical protein
MSRAARSVAFGCVLTGFVFAIVAVSWDRWLETPVRGDSGGVELQSVGLWGGCVYEAGAARQLCRNRLSDLVEGGGGGASGGFPTSAYNASAASGLGSVVFGLAAVVALVLDMVGRRVPQWTTVAFAAAASATAAGAFPLFISDPFVHALAQRMSASSSVALDASAGGMCAKMMVGAARLFGAGAALEVLSPLLGVPAEAAVPSVFTGRARWGVIVTVVLLGTSLINSAVVLRAFAQNSFVSEEGRPVSNRVGLWNGCAAAPVGQQVQGCFETLPDLLCGVFGCSGPDHAPRTRDQRQDLALARHPDMQLSQAQATSILATSLATLAAVLLVVIAHARFLPPTPRAWLQAYGLRTVLWLLVKAAISSLVLQPLLFSSTTFLTVASAVDALSPVPAPCTYMASAAALFFLTATGLLLLPEQDVQGQEPTKLLNSDADVPLATPLLLQENA